MKLNRRHFLVAATFAGGGLHLSRNWSFPVAPSDRVRVGVIAKDGHATDLSRYTAIPGMEIVALSYPSNGPRLSTLRDFAQRLTSFNQPAMYADWRSLVDRPDIDALFLSASGPEQSKIALAALDSGKDLLLERPGRSLDHLKTISDAALTKRRLAAHSYGTQFVGTSDARSEVLSSIQSLTTARAQHTVSVGSDTEKVADPAAQRREFLLNPVAEFDYARAVLGVSVPSSVSCVAMRQPHTGAITRAALRIEFSVADTKAIEIDIAGVEGPGADRHPAGGAIVFAGLGSGFAVQSIGNAFFRRATWSNFIDCVRSKQPGDLVAPVSELKKSLELLQLAEQSCTTGRTVFLK